MKKFLLMFAALMVTFGVSAKGVYTFALGTEMTLAEAAASETGFVLVSDNQILGIAKDGSADLKMYDINDIAIAYMVKLEAIDGVTGTSETEPNAYHVLFYKPNSTKIEAGNRYGIWGNGNCTLTAVSWGETWVAPNNSDKPDGRDFDYSARWNFEAQADGGFAVYFNNGEGRKYLNGGAISDNLQKVWHLHTLTKKIVATTSYDFTKITLDQALTTTDPVVMIQNDLVLCNSNAGANYASKSDFDEYSYWVKLEKAEGKGDYDYYISLNKDAETKVGYLAASVWSHVYINGQKAGDKEDGAIFTIASLEDGKYSIQNVGAKEGNYNTKNEDGTTKDDYTSKTYVTFQTTGYWTGNATWQNAGSSEWEFYTVTNMQTIPVGDEDPEPEEPTWTCPAGETDITTLPWVKNAQDCIIDFGEDKGNIFGTDASSTPLSYVDITNYSTIKVYGKAGSVVRAFINREEAAAADKQFIFVFDAIGEDGVASFDLSTVLAAQPNAKHIYLNGIKAGPNYNSTATVYGITLIEKPAPYTISTTIGKIGTIALDYPATIEGATLYEVVSFDATTGLELAEVEGDMVGGTPYIYVATADEVACTKTGASVEHGSYDCTKGEVGNGLVGSYSEVSTSGWLGYTRTSYIISNGKLRQIGKGNITLPANRCMFDPDKCTNKTTSSASLRIAVAEDATAITNVNASLEGGKIYDINGREVKEMKKGGIYIVGGMKVVIK